MIAAIGQSKFKFHLSAMPNHRQVDADRYGNTGVKSGLCGKQVSITNTENGHVRFLYF